MAREGQYDLYCSFHVSKEQELKWAVEQEKEDLAQLHRENDAYRIQCLVSGLDFYLSNYFDPAIALQLLTAILSKESLLDSFTKVLVSERALDLVERSSATGDVVAVGTKVASDLLQSVLDNPITVAPGYASLDAFGVLEEEKIRTRAAGNLKRCRA